MDFWNSDGKGEMVELEIQRHEDTYNWNSEGMEVFLEVVMDNKFTSFPLVTISPAVHSLPLCLQFASFAASCHKTEKLPLKMEPVAHDNTLKPGDQAFVTPYSTINSRSCPTAFFN